MSDTTVDMEFVREHLSQIVAGADVPEELTMKFRKVQGPASTEGNTEGREFSVSGPKADVVRGLIFANLGLTRKQIAELAKCSVSRVSEVVWGLEYDEVSYPEIPLRVPKPEQPVKEGFTPRDDKPLTGKEAEELIAMLERSIEETKAAKAAAEAKEFADQMAATTEPQEPAGEEPEAPAAGE